MAVKYNNVLFIAKKANPKAALQRVAKNYPAEYKAVCSLRNANAILYNLNASQFKRVLVEALRGVVKDGICKNPKF